MSNDPFADSKLNRDPVPTAPAVIGDIHVANYPADQGQITLPETPVPAEVRPILILPFSIVTQAKPDSDPVTFQKGVIFNSLLYKSRSYTDTMAITGLLASTTPAPDDAGWTDITPGASEMTPDDIWIEIPGSPGSIGTPAIKSLGAGNTFDGGEVESDGGTGSPSVFTQTFARKVLARIWFTDDGVIFIQQRVNTHLIMLNSPQQANGSTGVPSALIATVYPEAL